MSSLAYTTHRDSACCLRSYVCSISNRHKRTQAQSDSLAVICGIHARLQACALVLKAFILIGYGALLRLVISMFVQSNATLLSSYTPRLGMTDSSYHEARTTKPHHNSVHNDQHSSYMCEQCSRLTPHAPPVKVCLKVTLTTTGVLPVFCEQSMLNMSVILLWAVSMSCISP